jgi:hypothetical protein
MDLDSVSTALSDLYRRQPHLPRPPDLAPAILRAWRGVPASPPNGPNAAMTAVVALTWPYGATAGAARGHEFAAKAIRDLVAAVMTEPVAYPDGPQTMWALTRVADALPVTADATEVASRAKRFTWAGAGSNVTGAVDLGLAGGWLAGHRDATDRLLDWFVVRVIDLLGVRALAQPLLADGVDLARVLGAIETSTYMLADLDQDLAIRGRLAAPGQAQGPAAGRAFAPLRAVQPSRLPEPIFRPAQPPGPGRRGPSR